MIVDRDALQAALRRACELDVQAFKPGNVSVASPGNGMRAADFVASAAAIAAPISEPGLTVGERIFSAVQATRRVVECNTNLGIVLLVAPIIQALQIAAHDALPLRPSLVGVLNELTQRDADFAYRAIRLANPGGMGRSDQHDISQPPAVTLLQAMQTAAGRDRIALLYVTGYEWIFERALPLWREASKRVGNDAWAMTALFLNILGETPDSLIARKFGSEVAQRVSAEAKRHADAFNSGHDARQSLAQLIAWDTQLKDAAINPGTTADLCVATVFLDSVLGTR